MSEKSNAGGPAGPNTPGQQPPDPFSGFQRDDLRLKAIQSQHQTQREIVKTIAQASVRRAALAAAVAVVVFVGAPAMGMPVPWSMGLAAILSKMAKPL